MVKLKKKSPQHNRKMEDSESERDKAIEGKRDVQVGEGRTERTSILFIESLFRDRASCVPRPESDTAIQS